VSGARPVAAHRLKEMLAESGELALLDVREELLFSESHLLLARSAPLSRLELRVPLLVPRRGARVVLVDGGEGLAERAAHILIGYGYADVRVLEGGTRGWADAGYTLFSGVNVPSKAFGEVVEHASGTPSVDAAELRRMIDSGEDLVVLDSRPYDEFSRMSIPTAQNVPGAELVLRIADLAASPKTTVVVNCAGRTRSIIGAQSLIDAGVPNRVMALRNGTMGWTLAGFTPDRGSDRRLPASPPSAKALAWAKSAAARAAERAGVGRIDVATLARWRAEERTLCVFDVRDPREYAAGHLPGAVSAPGGQLVQATDQYVGTLNSRIVLVDELEVRAQMTGAWLRQMGWKEVFTLKASGTEAGWPAAPVLGAAGEPRSRLEAHALAALLAQGAATVIDLSLSREYRKAHIAGAWFAIRSRLDRSLSKIEPAGTVVLTSEDGILAALALEEMRSLSTAPARYLGGGNAAWTASGRALTADQPRLADDPIDVWLKPYDRSGGQAEAMQAYLDWEMDLLARVERDGSCRFERYKTEA
jgi:rhodanese-related sulfurtransferase